MEIKDKGTGRKKLISYCNPMKNFKDMEERKRQIRQQHILQIVNNTSQTDNKLQFLSKSSVQYLPVKNIKPKTPKENKHLQRESAKPLARGSKTQLIQKYLQTYAVSSILKDKHFLNTDSCGSNFKETSVRKNDISVSTTNEIETHVNVDDIYTPDKAEICLENSQRNLPLFDQKDIVTQKVQEAIKNQNIFLIRGDIPYLEESLRNRGWIQKYETTKTRHLSYGSFSTLDAPSLGDIHLPDDTLNEKAFIFQELKHISPNFIWDCRNDFTSWKGNIRPDTYLNRFQKSYIYTSKIGMAAVLEESHWFFEKEKAEVAYPRSYNVSRDKSAFTEDYRRTAAVSLLKWFVDQVEHNVDIMNKGTFPISSERLEFAIKRCEEIVAVANNDDIDAIEMLDISSQDWCEFIDDYIKVVHEGNNSAETENSLNMKKYIFEVSYKCTYCVLQLWSNEHLKDLYKCSIEILKKVKACDPQYDMNGMRNIWILKPNNLCCGNGITMTHKICHILKKVDNSPKDYFLVQKYIEKPLLIKNTKFDVRHWYLVTNSYPLTIWIYRESLLRFSSRPFTFVNYHEVIHICNTAVQCKYSDQKNSVRSMNWDCEMINQYLKEEAGYKGEPWYDIIYPKMCQAIIGTMLAAQDKMEKRKYSFELYGADFVIMDDLSVWLIEINTNPRMNPPSSKLTERLYTDVLESLIKVVLDYPSNPDADTGNFVLAYKQNITSFKSYMETYMFVNGAAIPTKQINFA